MRTNQIVAVCMAVGTAALLIIAMKPHEQVFLYITPDNSVSSSSVYKTWKACFTSKVESFRGDPEKTWRSIGNKVRECERPHVGNLKMLDFANSDETKIHILPIKNTGDKSVIITLGVGHDTAAEEKLMQTMGNDSVEFYGADPMVEINEGLYSKFGSFFPFAISAKPGISKASVLDRNYHDKLVVHVDAVYFLKNLVGKTFIDDIWVDAEGAEYELFPFFYKGGAFDENGIIFCQINMEIHKPDADQKKLIHDFLYKMLDDGRYGFFRPVQANHMRLYFFNFEDSRCVEKYIPTNFNATLPSL